MDCETSRKGISIIWRECQFGCRQVSLYLCVQSANQPVRIENGATRLLAGHRLIENGREVIPLLQRRVERRNGHYSPGRLNTGRWPDVPGQPNA